MKLKRAVVVAESSPTLTLRTKYLQRLLESVAITDEVKSV